MRQHGGRKLKRRPASGAPAQGFGGSIEVGVGPVPGQPQAAPPAGNTQLNLKVSADVLARFTALADRHRIPFGALLEQLLVEVGDEAI